MHAHQHHQLQQQEARKTRAAELRDELLFKQPASSHLGDCPICVIPQSFLMIRNLYNAAKEFVTAIPLHIVKCLVIIYL